MVPLRSAATGLGMPALTRLWVPMMLRVRPAQLTITRVAGSGARSRTRSASSAPGTLVPPGMLMVVYSSKRRTSSTTTSAWACSRACTSSAARLGRVAHMLDQFAKALAGHVDVAEQLAAGVTPAGQAAVQQVHLAVAQRLQRARGGRGQAFAVVEDGDGHVQPRQPPRRVQGQAASAELHRPQRVGLGKRVFFTHIDQGDLAACQQVRPHLGGAEAGQIGARGLGLVQGVGHQAASLDRSHRFGNMALL